MMIKTTVHLLEEYDIRFDNSRRIFVDGANPSFIRPLKEVVYEDPKYEDQINRWESDNGENVVTLERLQQNMFILPVAFGKEHKRMLAHCKEVMEYHTGMVAINSRHNKLITALRTAEEKGDGAFDKEATSDDDLLDAFRISLQFWH
jgi:hypothetical protein